MVNKYSRAKERILAKVGYSELRPSDESVWRRGWNDTKAGLLNWRFALLDFVGAPVLGWLTAPYWGAIAAIGVIVFIWIGATARAPFKQRDEARAEIHPSNASDVDEAIAGLQSKTEQVGAIRISLADALQALALELVRGLDENGAGGILKRKFGGDGQKWYYGSIRIMPHLALMGITVSVPASPQYPDPLRSVFVVQSNTVYYLTPLGRRVYQALIVQSNAGKASSETR